VRLGRACGYASPQMKMADPDATARSAAAATPPAAADTPTSDLALPRGCPFLLADAGGWRLALPAREHRCAAFMPPAPLSPEKQARLCLTPAHTGCATFLASLAAREARLGAPSPDRATRWGLARTTAVIEDSGGLRGRLLGLLLDRRRWPAIPAVLLVTTLFTLAISGFRGGLPASAAATASPGAPASTPALTSEPTAAPTATAAPEQTTSAPPTVAPTVAAEATPNPTPRPTPTYRQYVVRSGDTLVGIAGSFGVSVGSIASLNHISDPSRLSIGQVLLIP
jgi:LysM repeat protein